MANALSDNERGLMDAYWRASNSLSVGQIFPPSAAVENVAIQDTAAADTYLGGDHRALGMRVGTHRATQILHLHGREIHLLPQIRELILELVELLLSLLVRLLGFRESLLGCGAVFELFPNCLLPGRHHSAHRRHDITHDQPHDDPEPHQLPEESPPLFKESRHGRLPRRS